MKIDKEIEKDFIPFQEALELKKIGFDEPCLGYYDLDGLQVSTHHWYPENKNSSFPLQHTTNNPKVSAPTFSQTFRWFRNKNYILDIVNDVTKNNGGDYYYDIWKNGKYMFESGYEYKTYEDA